MMNKSSFDETGSSIESYDQYLNNTIMVEATAACARELLFGIKLASPVVGVDCLKMDDVVAVVRLATEITTSNVLWRT